jgi:signal transduction histidine kinase
VSKLDERLEIAEAAVAESRRLRRQLLSALSHDLRGPMGTILLWEQLLRDRIEDENVRRQALDAIREAATMQSELIAELLDLATALGDSEQWTRRRIGLEMVLSAAIESCMPAARAKQLSLAPALSAPLGTVDAEPARLRDAFAKIFETAIRVTAPGATIAIHGQRGERTIELAVGASLDELSPEQERAALDIGLVSASEILSLHAGTLESIRIRRGAAPAFRIVLPSTTTRSSRS